jgi:hypothetical protein
MTMLNLCLLAFTVAIATLATPVVVQIMWNKIEGGDRGEGAKPIAPRWFPRLIPKRLS